MSQLLRAYPPMVLAVVFLTSCGSGAGCEPAPPLPERPRPMGSPAPGGTDASKPQAATPAKVEEGGIDETYECTAESRSRPTRRPGNIEPGFYLDMICPDGDAKTSQRVFFLGEDNSDLLRIGKETTVAAVKKDMAGTSRLVFKEITGSPASGEEVPGSGIDFNELLLRMPKASGENAVCSVTGRVQEMNIGSDRLLRKQAGDNARDSYFYVECGGSAWGNEGLMVFFEKDSDDESAPPITPKKGDQLSVKITGLAGAEFFITSQYVP